MSDFVAYFALAGAALLGLAAMILRIGALLGTCPSSGAAIRTAAIASAAGFVAIGGGGVILIAAGLAILGPGLPEGSLYLATGFAWLCLGLGFGNAVTGLRGVLRESRPRGTPEPA